MIAEAGVVEDALAVRTTEGTQVRRNTSENTSATHLDSDVEEGYCLARASPATVKMRAKRAVVVKKESKGNEGVRVCRDKPVWNRE